MKLEFMTLCDYAGVDAKGKATLLGMFSRFEFPELPVDFPRFYVAIFFKAEVSDVGTEPKLKVRLLDQNGTPTAVDQELLLGKVPGSKLEDGEVRLNLFLEVNGLKFTQYGKYQLIVEVDGKRVGKASVGVRTPGEGGLIIT